jgi:Tubulin-tyrosine ligase family
MGRNGICFEDVLGSVKDTVAKSLVAVQPGLAHHYTTTLPPGHSAFSCFELLGGRHLGMSSDKAVCASQSRHAVCVLELASACNKTCGPLSHQRRSPVAGYDILLDQYCKPWLLEVNHSPSFSVGSALDATVKEAVLLDTLRMVRHTAHACWR